MVCPVSDGPVLFAESGGRWRTVAYGPLLCLLLLATELVLGGDVHVLGLAVSAVVLAALVALPVTAARSHASVEVTADELRCGCERVPLADVAEVLPAADPAAEDLEPWETARALGDLSGVPRKRTPIGLRLVDGELVRAWARDGDGLREVLSTALASADDGDRSGA